MALQRYYDDLFQLEGNVNLGVDENYLVSYDGFIDTQYERRILIRLQKADGDGVAIADAPELLKWVRPQETNVTDGSEVELES